MRPDQMDLETLSRMLDLPVEDPERKRFEASPENASLLLAYRRFLAAPDIAEARPDDAESEMRAFVAERTARRPAAARTGTVGFVEWMRQIMRPQVLAPAAFVMVLAVGATLWQSRQPEPSVLRNVDGTESLTLNTPEALPNGSFRVSWAPLAGADAYEVRLLATDLQEVDRIGSVLESELVVSASVMATFQDIRFWQVIALTGGDELLRSGIEILK